MHGNLFPVALWQYATGQQSDHPLLLSEELCKQVMIDIGLHRSQRLDGGAHKDFKLSESSHWQTMQVIPHVARYMAIPRNPTVLVEL